MNENNAFNPAAIERLCRLGGKKFAGEMIDLFFSYGAKKIGEARQARDAGNLVTLADATHPLKSSAGNVGAVRVQELAEQVESSAHEQKAELAGAKFDELERAFAEIKTVLESARAQLAKSPAGSETPKTGSPPE